MKRIAMLGGNGAGMRGLAILLAAEGATIISVDRSGGDGVLREEAAEPAVVESDLIIHTDAIAADHPLLRAAREKRIPTQIYHEALAAAAANKRTIAITGTHGKSSTTSMLAHIFVEAGYDPTALVGAPNPAWNNTNARVGKGPWFIVEADEYHDHFLALKIESAIITTIDFDHPDWFNSLDDVVESFTTFVKSIPPDGVLIAPTAVTEKFSNIPWPASTKAIKAPAKPIQLILPGEHMQYNAWLAIHMALHYGISQEKSRAALATYPGLGRRFELLGRLGDMDVVSDYGHHPAEIAVTLQAARERYKNGAICAIFEAHTRERLLLFEEDFFKALAAADAVILVPPFIPAGRSSIQIDVAEAVERLSARLTGAGREVHVLDSISSLSQLLTSLQDRFAVSLAFSAGSADAVLRATVKPR